ncbi:hypothetical protein [Xanthobacter autotrophicus]|uniref:hypothetical protein n=1 Tax=Xanthobacter autotrophicus TaxID=280 RepID=UPI003726937D
MDLAALGWVTRAERSDYDWVMTERAQLPCKCERIGFRTVEVVWKERMDKERHPQGAGWEGRLVGKLAHDLSGYMIQMHEVHLTRGSPVCSGRLAARESPRFAGGWFV